MYLNNKMEVRIENIIEESYLVYSEEDLGERGFNDYIREYVITEDEEKITQLRNFCERAKKRLEKYGKRDRFMV